MPTILFIPRIPLPLPIGRASSAKVPVCPDCGTAADSDAHECAGCGRVIERPTPAVRSETSPSASSPLSPTAAGAWLVLAILLVVVVGGPFYWWRSQLAQVPRPESELEQKLRLQSEAELEMLKESTNVVVGLNRIIRASVTKGDDNPYKWGGEVVAEFINRVGGIERTNVFFKFRTDTGSDGLVHLRCGVESEGEHRARQRADRR